MLSAEDSLSVLDSASLAAADDSVLLSSAEDSALLSSLLASAEDSALLSSLEVSALLSSLLSSLLSCLLSSLLVSVAEVSEETAASVPVSLLLPPKNAIALSTITRIKKRTAQYFVILAKSASAVRALPLERN